MTFWLGSSPLQTQVVSPGVLSCSKQTFENNSCLGFACPDSIKKYRQCATLQGNLCIFTRCKHCDDEGMIVRQDKISFGHAKNFVLLTVLSVDHFIEEDRERYRWFHRRTPTREQGTCRTTAPINGFIEWGRGAINGFIEGRQGGREQGTPHDSGICVAFHLWFAAERNSLIQVFGKETPWFRCLYFGWFWVDPFDNSTSRNVQQLYKIHT